MSGTVNTIILTGRVGKKPVLVKNSLTHQSFTSFPLVLSVPEAGRIIVRCENTHLSRVIARHCRKGTLIYLKGQISTRFCGTAQRRRCCHG